MNTLTDQQRNILNRYTGGIYAWTPEESRKTLTALKDLAVAQVSGIAKLPADVMQIFPENSNINALGNRWENGVDYLKDKLMSDQAVKDYYATKEFYKQNGVLSNPAAVGINPIYNWSELAGGVKFATRATAKGINLYHRGRGQVGKYYLKETKDFIKGAARGENANINGTMMGGIGIYNDYYKGN